MRRHDFPLLNQNYRRVPIEQSARLDVSAMAASSTSPQERARQRGGASFRERFSRQARDRQMGARRVFGGTGVISAPLTGVASFEIQSGVSSPKVL